MKPELSEILIQKGVIRQHTLIEAYHQVKGLSCVDDSKVLGEFVVLNAKKRQGEILFDVLYENNTKKEIHAIDVISVDGMDEPRLAEAFMLKTSGETLPEQKKRGRKSKEQQRIDILRNKAMDFIKLLDFGWNEEKVIEKLDISAEELDEILEILEE